MVKPINLQDNISKTWLAQEVMDKEVEGAKRAHELSANLVQKERDKAEKRQVTGLGEKPGAEAVSREPHQKKGKKKKKKKGKKSPLFELPGSDEHNDGLRPRHPEDDKGKGEVLDVKG